MKKQKKVAVVKAGHSGADCAFFRVESETCGNIDGLDFEEACPYRANARICGSFQPFEEDKGQGTDSATAAGLPDVSPAEAGKLLVLDPARLRPSPFQVRQIRGTPELDAELASLAESIRANGVVQPLTVRYVEGGEGYEIVAGHRRHAAAVLAGAETVPCYLVEASDLQAESALVVENLQRRDLTAIEEADSVARMSAKTSADAAGNSSSARIFTIDMALASPLLFRSAHCVAARARVQAQRAHAEDDPWRGRSSGHPPTYPIREGPVVRGPVPEEDG
jgi:ParB/RepB/Spo0J family partition protein